LVAKSKGFCILIIIIIIKIRIELLPVACGLLPVACGLLPVARTAIARADAKKKGKRGKQLLKANVQSKCA